MRWIRQNVGWAAQLALFALAVHMFVSFGHVHANGVASVAGTYVPGVSAAGENIGSATIPAPTHPYRSPAAHDFCAVCVHIGLFSFLIPVLSTPVALQQSARIRYWDTATNGVANPPRSSFQARAPPLA